MTLFLRQKMIHIFGCAYSREQVLGRRQHIEVGEWGGGGGEG